MRKLDGLCGIPQETREYGGNPEGNPTLYGVISQETQ